MTVSVPGLLVRQVLPGPLRLQGLPEQEPGLVREPVQVLQPWLPERLGLQPSSRPGCRPQIPWRQLMPMR